MRCQGSRLRRIQRAQCVRSQKLLIFAVFHQTKPRERSRSNSLNLINPDRIRVFTVPNGSPRRSEISASVKPSKYASSRVRRYS